MTLRLLYITVCTIVLSRATVYRSSPCPPGSPNCIVPFEDQMVSFNCTRPTDASRPVYWILPNGTRITVVGDLDHNNGDLLLMPEMNTVLDNSEPFGNSTGTDNGSQWELVPKIIDDTFAFTPRQLIIQSVKTGMDGVYTCVTEDKRRERFYVPYIIGHTEISHSLWVSLAVTAFFTCSCLAVLIFDRCKSRRSIADTMDEPIANRRKSQGAPLKKQSAQLDYV